MTHDEAESIIWDFLIAVSDAETFQSKPSYQDDKEEFRQKMIAALQFAPVTIFAAQDGMGKVGCNHWPGQKRCGVCGMNET